MLDTKHANHRPGLRFVYLAVVAVAWAASPETEAAARRWYFQAGVSYFEAMDEIRSNAAIIYTQQYGDDGIPFTGDPNEKTACTLNRGDFYPDQDPFCDPRPDDLVAREPSMEETFGFDLAVGFLVAPRFALQLNAGLVESEAPEVDVYLEETIPVANAAGLYSRLVDRTVSSPTATGTLRQVPVSISGIVRFLPGRALNLYAGAGAGYLFTDTDVDEDLVALNAQLESLRIRKIGDEIGTDLSPGGFKDTIIEFEGRMPFEYPLSVEAEDGWFWQLTGGLEYRMTDALGIVIDARYVQASQALEISLAGHDQIDLVTLPGVLFRPDGSLRIFSPDANAPNPLCGGLRGAPYGCIDADINTRVNPEGMRAGFPDPLPGVTCPANGDFDINGLMDTCFTKGLISPSGQTAPTAIWAIQGGEADLDFFSVGLSLRVYLPSRGHGGTPPQN